MNSNQYQELAARTLIDGTTAALTPRMLREVLDVWCEAQPDVLRVKPKTRTRGGCEYEYWCVQPIRSLKGNREGWTACAIDSKAGTFLHCGLHLLALTTLAIEHRYIPWLQFAAAQPYTGAQAAKVALADWNELEESVKPKPLAEILSQVQQDLGDRATIEPMPKRPPLIVHDDDLSGGWE